MSRKPSRNRRKRRAREMRSAEARDAERCRNVWDKGISRYSLGPMVMLQEYDPRPRGVLFPPITDSSNAEDGEMLRVLEAVLHEANVAFLTKPSPLLKRLANGDDRGQNPAPLRWP